MIEKEFYPYLWNPDQYVIDKGKEINENQMEILRRIREKRELMLKKYENKIKSI